VAGILSEEYTEFKTRYLTYAVLKILDLTISAFRGFGRNEHPPKLDRDLVLFYGPNGYPLSDSPHFR
jgi:hypothetical protein